MIPEWLFPAVVWGCDAFLALALWESLRPRDEYKERLLREERLGRVALREELRFQRKRGLL